MIPKIEKLVGGLGGKKIGMLGLSFKPETDDMRESPAIDIIKAIHRRRASFKRFDPVAMEEASITLPASNMRRTNTMRSNVPMRW